MSSRISLYNLVISHFLPTMSYKAYPFPWHLTKRYYLPPHFLLLVWNERAYILSNYTQELSFEELRHSHRLPFSEEPKIWIDRLLFTNPRQFPVIIPLCDNKANTYCRYLSVQRPSFKRMHRHQACCCLEKETTMKALYPQMMTITDLIRPRGYWRNLIDWRDGYWNHHRHQYYYPIQIPHRRPRSDECLGAGHRWCVVAPVLIVVVVSSVVANVHYRNSPKIMNKKKRHDII